MKPMKPAFIGLAALTLVACGGGSVDSSDLKTEGIHATIRINAYEDTTYVDCRLTAGGPNGSDVELSEGDRLTARAYGETKTLEREPQLFGAYDSYITEFDHNIAGETLFIRLVRAKDPDATNTYVTIPARVEVFSPATMENNLAAIDEDFTIQWSQNFQGDVDIDTLISCPTVGVNSENYIGSSSTTMADTGEFTVNFYSLVDADARDTLDTSVDCEGSVHIQRQVEGVLDSNYDGGNIKLTQSQSVHFVLDF